MFNLNKAHANDHALVLSAVLSHNQLERKVALVLNTLDLLSSFTTMDESIRASVKALAELSSTKHQLVQRKAKQIAQMARDNVAESHKEVVLPELKRIASGMLSEQEEHDALANVKVRATRTVTLGHFARRLYGAARHPPSQVHFAHTQPKMLAMLNTSDKGLRRAVIKAAVQVWYGDQVRADPGGDPGGGLGAISARSRRDLGASSRTSSAGA